ncbi:MAG: hypothetical protein ABJA57_11615, partial [Ginsengibacter sp.]
DESSYNYIYNKFNGEGINARFNMLPSLENALIKTKNINDVNKQAGILLHFRDDLPAFIKQFSDAQINGALRNIAAAKKATGQGDVALNIESKIPATPEDPKEIKITAGNLQKYAGDYELNGMTLKVNVTDASLHLIVPGQPEYTLAAIGDNIFTIKSLTGFTVQFNLDNKGDVIEMLSIQPNGTFTAKKTK